MPHTTREEIEESSHLKRAFIPTKVEAGALLVGSFLALLALNTLPAIKTIDGVNYAMATDYIREIMEKLLAPTNNQETSRILTVVFWMVIGMAAYIIVWMLTSMISNYRRDIVETKGMILPNGFNKDAAWHETVFRIIVRMLSTIVFLYWIYVFFAAILPHSSKLFLNSITYINVASVATVIIATLMLAASVFVAIVFARCIVLRERVFES